MHGRCSCDSLHCLPRANTTCFVTSDMRTCADGMGVLSQTESRTAFQQTSPHPVVFVGPPVLRKRGCPTKLAPREEGHYIARLLGRGSDFVRAVPKVAKTVLFTSRASTLEDVAAGYPTLIARKRRGGVPATAAPAQEALDEARALLRLKEDDADWHEQAPCPSAVQRARAMLDADRRGLEKCGSCKGCGEGEACLHVAVRLQAAKGKAGAILAAEGPGLIGKVFKIKNRGELKRGKVIEFDHLLAEHKVEWEMGTAIKVQRSAGGSRQVDISTSVDFAQAQHVQELN